MPLAHSRTRYKGSKAAQGLLRGKTALPELSIQSNHLLSRNRRSQRALLPFGFSNSDFRAGQSGDVVQVPYRGVVEILVPQPKIFVFWPLVGLAPGIYPNLSPPGFQAFVPLIFGGALFFYRGYQMAALCAPAISDRGPSTFSPPPFTKSTTVLYSISPL